MASQVVTGKYLVLFKCKNCGRRMGRVHSRAEWSGDGPLTAAALLMLHQHRSSKHEAHACARGDVGLAYLTGIRPTIEGEPDYDPMPALDPDQGA
jgi:hypothetical protein